MKPISNSKNCENCGSDHKSKPFCNYDNGQFCFSCGYFRGYDRSFKIRDFQTIIPNNPDWPEALSNPADFSLQNLKWLTQYHVTYELIRKRQIQEISPGTLFFPNIVNDKFVGYQTRQLNPRFISTRGDKQPCYFINNKYNSSLLIIVEDFISAIRVGEQYNSCCLWGTKANYGTIKEWFNMYDDVLICLDNDHIKQTNSGQIAADKIRQKAQSIIYYHNRKRFTPHKFIRNVVTDRDLKWHTDSEIREIIQGALHVDTE